MLEVANYKLDFANTKVISIQFQEFALNEKKTKFLDARVSVPTGERIYQND